MVTIATLLIQSRLLSGAVGCQVSPGHDPDHDLVTSHQNASQHVRFRNIAVRSLSATAWLYSCRAARLTTSLRLYVSPIIVPPPVLRTPLGISVSGTLLLTDRCRWQTMEAACTTATRTRVLWRSCGASCTARRISTSARATAKCYASDGPATASAASTWFSAHPKVRHKTRPHGGRPQPRTAPSCVGAACPPVCPPTKLQRLSPSLIPQTGVVL